MRRIYRELFDTTNFYTLELNYKQSNIFIKSCPVDKFELFSLLKKLINQLEEYISKRKEFYVSLKPIKQDRKAPIIAKKMIEASKTAGVGPMASVAGAIAEQLGKHILKKCDECVVENGGDIFLKLNKDPIIGVFTYNPYYKDKIKILITAKNKPLGICSSSSKIGPSLSKGKADLAVIIDKDTALADAMATATANIIKKEEDIEKAIEFSKNKDVLGCLFIKDKKIGLWGNLKLVY